MLETLDAAAVRRWCGGGLEALRAHQHEIDELNVYPVPDGDTGTNLVLTLTSAHEALETPGAIEASGAIEVSGAIEAEEPTPLGRAMRRMARGALLGARGNSGVIVSQILRGMADSLAASVAVRGGELARALRSASEAAYSAVARPVEGTVLSVVAAAAEGAGRLKSDDLLAVAREAARSASEALARTPEQLPILARAGVVDAGGRGLCLLLDALVEALTTTDGDSAIGRCGSHCGHEGGSEGGSGKGGSEGGRGRGREGGSGKGGSEGGRGRGREGDGESGRGRGSEEGDGEGEGEGRRGRGGERGVGAAPGVPDAHAQAGAFGYEVQYLLDAESSAIEGLRLVLARLGDSLVVVGSGEDGVATWNVHVHVPAAAIGAALEAGIEAGRPHRVSVTPLDRGEHAADPGKRGAVVVAAGDGLTALFEDEGAVVVGRNPSTREMLEAITATGARSVVLLPNDANTHAVATSAAREAEAMGVRVSVVPTRSPVQALAALAVRDPARPFADDVIGMAEAAGACRYGEVCTAQRDSLTVAGPCQAGDLLGLVDGEVHVIGTDLAEVSRRLIDRMLGGGGELATVVLGADAPAGLDRTLSGHVTQTWPFVELQCYAGGQPRYHLLVGVE